VRAVHISNGACQDWTGGCMLSLAQAGDDTRFRVLFIVYARGVEEELCIDAMYQCRVVGYMGVKVIY